MTVITASALLLPFGILVWHMKAGSDPAEPNLYTDFDPILQKMSDLLIVADDGGKISRVNLPVLELLGCEEKELIGRDIGDICSDDEFIRKNFVMARHKLFCGGEISSLLRVKGGREIPVTISSLPTPEGSARGAGAVLLIRPKVDEAVKAAASGKGRHAPADGSGMFQDIVEKSLVGIFVILDGNFIYINPKMAEIFGYSAEDMMGASLTLDIVEQHDRKRIADNISALAAGKRKSMQFAFSGRQKDGNVIDVETFATSMNFNGGRAVVGSLYEITERMLMEEAIRHQAYHDPLTSLPNRILFNGRLSSAITKAQLDRTKLAVLFLDLDSFKNINDTRGHNTGDMVLQSIAGLLQGCLRESDTVARLGGDEYTVLLPHINHDEDAVMVAQKILAAVNQKWMLDGYRLSLTTSIGISIYPTDGRDAETLLRKADAAMYHVKELGGNAIRLYDPSLDAGSAELMQLESDLRTALENGELHIYYQPQVDMSTWMVSGVEALIRWNHPERGLLSPKQFVPLAEKTGLIVPIGEWVLRMACHEVKRWQDKGFESLKLSVNVSAVQLLKQDFVDIVDRVLKRTTLAPENLQLEITEGMALQNLDALVPTLMKLSGLGVRLVIDDFGLGYSSLNFLKRLPVQSVKIDKGLINELSANADDSSIITALIAMAKSLDLDTFAEGVETEAQMSLLHKCRCDKMQGYLFSRPLPPSEIENILKR